MGNILLAGGSGLVGSRLTEILLEKNHRVGWLTRQPAGSGPMVEHFHWQPNRSEIDPAAIDWADAVVNLAGAGIAEKRWSAERKKELLDSRIGSTALLKTAIESSRNPPKTYLGASAVGFYGHRGDEVLTENAPSGTGFLSECCVAWEKAHAEIAALGPRSAVVRIGIVLSEKGGALPEMMRPIRFGSATWFGDGRAWYPWLHIDDLCRLFLFLLENENLSGVFNAAAPEPLTIKELTRKIASGMGRPWAVGMPVPAFALRLLFGEMADCLLNSDRVSSEKIRVAGFDFQFNDAEAAVRDLLERRV